MDVIDIIQRLTGHNIIMLDIPTKHNDSADVLDYDNVRLVCPPNTEYDKSKPFLIIIKKSNGFELVVYIDQSKQTSEVVYSFNYHLNESRPKGKSKQKELGIINLLLDFYDTSCIKENVYPYKFPFDELWSLDEVINLFKDTNYHVIAQVANVFNKVEYALCHTGILIPVKETGISDIVPRVSFKQLVEKDKLLDIDSYIKRFERVNQMLKDKGSKNKLDIKGVSTTFINGKLMNTGLLTNFGVFIPIKKTPYDVANKVPRVEMKYYQDVNAVLKENDQERNDQVGYNQSTNQSKQLIFKIKETIAIKLVSNESIKGKIESIIKKVKTPRATKIKQLIPILSEMTKDVEGLAQSDLEFYLHVIANEMVNDNKENLILNNMVTSDVFNPNEVIRREGESLLLTVDDVYKWLKRVGRTR